MKWQNSPERTASSGSIQPAGTVPLLPVAARTIGLSRAGIFTVSATCIVSFVVGVAAVWMLKPTSKGEWKSTGDGKTVVHSITGEIKYTATGKTVEQVAEETRIANEELSQKAAADAKLQAVIDLLQREERAKARYELIRHNAQIVNQTKKYMDSHPVLRSSGYGASSWDEKKVWFSTQRLPSDLEVQLTLNFLVGVKTTPGAKIDSELQPTIDALANWKKQRHILDEERQLIADGDGWQWWMEDPEAAPSSTKTWRSLGTVEEVLGKATPTATK